jgi:hypothetical protein
VRREGHARQRGIAAIRAARDPDPLPIDRTAADSDTQGAGRILEPLDDVELGGLQSGSESSQNGSDNRNDNAESQDGNIQSDHCLMRNGVLRNE